MLEFALACYKNINLSLSFVFEITLTTCKQNWKLQQESYCLSKPWFMTISSFFISPELGAEIYNLFFLFHEWKKAVKFWVCVWRRAEKFGHLEQFATLHISQSLKKLCRQSCAIVNDCEFIKSQGFCSDPRFLLEKELFQLSGAEERRAPQLSCFINAEEVNGCV